MISYKKKLAFSLLFCLTINLMTLMAQDWANLKKFQEKNAKIDMTTNDQRVVFMGNSITIGWLNMRPAYFANKPYINRGIGGQTTPQMLLRFRQDVLDVKPKVVVILAGINDIAGNTGPMTLEEIAGNIFSMATLAKANNIDVLFCSVLPAFDFPWRPGMEPAPKVVRLNEMLKAYAKENGHGYVDYFTAMVDDRLGLPKSLASDGIHPTVKGYKMMEPILEKALTDLLKN